MNQEEINKAFEGRWRMKNYILENIDGKAAKEIARDFFEAGIALSEPPKVEYTYPDDYSETLFNLWWERYDKKRGKEKCLKKWNKLKRIEQETCCRVVDAYVASTPDKTYRKDPLTYLNGKCWNDEIIIRQSTDQQRQQRLAAAAELIAEYTKDGK